MASTYNFPGGDSRVRPPGTNGAISSRGNRALMSIRLLVAGNTLPTVESARTQLEPMDCQIIRAPGAALAFYLANKNFPDLILCNPDMPEGTGIEFLAEIKADTELAKIPFVFICSENQGRAFYGEALRLGAREVIVEPATAVELIRELQPFLQELGLDRPPESPE